MTAGAPPRGSAALPAADALFAHAPCGLLVTDEDGLVRAANDTLCAWVDRDADALVGRVRFQDLLAVGSRIFHQTHWAPLLQLQGSVSEVKLELLAAAGARLPIMVNAVRHEHPGGLLHKIALFAVEDRHQYERELLAERRRAEELLRSERQAREELAATQAELEQQRATAEDRALFAEQMMGIVSHDLRNPLAVVDMSVRLLARDDLSEAQHKTLQRLKNSNDLALRLIADLLDFTQARLGRGLSVALQQVDLHRVVADSLEDLRLAFPQRRIVHVRRGEGSCVAGADRLVQAVGNLVSNAVRHGDAGGAITVTSEVGAARCSLAVHNEGAPIDAGLLPRIFEPMVRGAGRAAVQGVGLGLYIVSEIARVHGGAVSVDSGAGRGTTFTMEFASAPCAGG